MCAFDVLFNSVSERLDVLFVLLLKAELACVVSVELAENRLNQQDECLVQL